jgi:selenoprotein W-related protein
MQVEIEYCVRCGLLDRAIEVERDLLSRFGERIETVSLKTGSGGVFKVRVDGEEVLDGGKDGYDLEAVRSSVGYLAG